MSYEDDERWRDWIGWKKDQQKQRRGFFGSRVAGGSPAGKRFPVKSETVMYVLFWLTVLGSLAMLFKS